MPASSPQTRVCHRCPDVRRGSNLRLAFPFVRRQNCVPGARPASAPQTTSAPAYRPTSHRTTACSLPASASLAHRTSGTPSAEPLPSLRLPASQPTLASACKASLHPSRKSDEELYEPGLLPGCDPRFASRPLRSLPARRSLSASGKLPSWRTSLKPAVSAGTLPLPPKRPRFSRTFASARLPPAA